MKYLVILCLVLLTATCQAQTSWSDPATGIYMMTRGPWKVKAATSKNAIGPAYLQNSSTFSENGEITITSGKSAEDAAKKAFELTQSAIKSAGSSVKILSEGKAGTEYQIAYLVTDPKGKPQLVAAAYLPLRKAKGKIGVCMVRAIIASEAEVPGKLKEFKDLLKGFLLKK